MVKFSGTGAKFSDIRAVSTAKITRAVPKNSGTRTKILAVPCPTCYNVKGVLVLRRCTEIQRKLTMR